MDLFTRMNYYGFIYKDEILFSCDIFPTSSYLSRLRLQAGIDIPNIKLSDLIFSDRIFPGKLSPKFC